MATCTKGITRSFAPNMGGVDENTPLRLIKKAPHDSAIDICQRQFAKRKKGRKADPALLAQNARASSFVVMARRRILSCFFSFPVRLKTSPWTNASQARTKTRRVRSRVADIRLGPPLCACEIGTVRGICTFRACVKRRRRCRRENATKEANALHMKLFCQDLSRA